MNYIGRHWRGELTLAISFWVNVVLLNIIIIGTLTWLGENPPVEHPRVLARILISCYLIATLVIYPWQIIGLWRSADRHIEETKKAGWARTAQVFIVIGLLGTAARLNQDWPIYTQLYEVGFGKDEFDTYVLKLEKDNTILHIQGGLGFGVSREAAEILDNHPEINTIILDSAGGRIYEGRQLAELIFMNGLDTVSLKGCYSACAIAYIAGKTRYLSRNANLAFHQYQSGVSGLDTSTNMEAEQEKDLRLFRRQGVAQEFLDELFNTPRDDFWYPTLDELVEAGVVHDVVYSSDIAPKQYQGDAADAEKALLELPVFRALKKYDPDVYRQLSKEMVDLLEIGVSVLEAQSKMASKFQSLVTKNLPVSSDEALIRFTKAVVGALQELRDIDPILCLKAMYPQQYGSVQFSKHLSKDSMAAYFDTLELVIVDAYEKVNPNVNIQEANDTILKVVPVLEDQAEYLELQNLHTRDDYRKSCSVAIRLYELILAEDHTVAANTLRYLYQTEGE